MIRTHVLVCGGTGCTSSGSVKIMDALNAEIAAHGLAEGDIVGPIVVVAIVAIIAAVGVIFRDRIMDALGKGEQS